MILAWDNIKNALYYVIYKTDGFNIPDGHLNNDICLCSDDFIPLDEASKIYLPGINEDLLPYLNPPDGFEFFAYTTDNYYDVPDGFYTIVAVSETCASSYSSLVRSGASIPQSLKTISFSACGFSLTSSNNDYQNIRSPRWGLHLNKIDISFNYNFSSLPGLDNTSLQVVIYRNYVDSDNIVYSKSIEISGSGDITISKTIDNDILPEDNVILLISDSSLVSTQNIIITNLSITLTGYITDIPTQILLDNFDYEEHVDRWSLNQSSSDYKQIGYYGEGGFLITKAYKSPIDGSSSCKIIIRDGASYFSEFLPIREPLLVPVGSELIIEGSGEPFLSTFHISDKVSINLDNIVDSDGVYFDGGIINSHISSFTKTFYMNATIAYIDVWRVGGSSESLTISGPFGSQIIPITDIHTTLDLNIKVNAGDEITFSCAGITSPNCLDIRFEYWKKSNLECLCEQNLQPSPYGTYNFEDIIMFDGVGGTRFRTYNMNFDAHRIIIQPHRGTLIGGTWSLTILEDGRLLQTISSTDDLARYDEDIDINFNANKTYTFIFNGSDETYSEGPPDISVYLRGETDGALYMHGSVLAYDSIDRHIPSSHPDGTSDPWIETTFSYPFEINLYAVGVSCDTDDMGGGWELLIPDYSVDIGVSTNVVEVLSTSISISAYTMITFKHKITGFPTVNLFYKKVSEYIDPSRRYYCTTEGALLKSSEYSGGFIIPYEASNPLHYLEVEMSLSHPPATDITYSVDYSDGTNWLSTGLGGTISTGQNYILKYSDGFSLEPASIKQIKITFPDGWSDESSIFINLTFGTLL